MKLTDFTEAFSDKQALALYNPDSETYKGTKNRIPNSKSISKKDITVKGKQVDFPSGSYDPPQVKSAEQSALKQKMADVLDTLTKREAAIIKARFGLTPFDREYTLDEVGKILNISRSRVREIEGKALRKLKHPNRSRTVISFMDSLQELKIVKPDSVDTKGLKRVEMPQIHKDDYNEFIDYLKDNGAEFTKQTMPAQQLKATQGEFSDKGVMKQIDKQMRGEPRKPVIASQDNYIIDGHHRWLVAWNTKDSLDVFKVNINADKLLKLVKDFPKTTYKDIYTEDLYDFDKDEPMKSTVAVPGYGTMSVDGLMKNLVQSVTELLGRMKQGTDGMRFADYELNKNGVVTAKLSALIQALDDLQAIRKKGGSNSRNIQKEQEQEPLPIDTDKVFRYIQQLESGQSISPQDADLMRKGIQSLESARQTLNPQAILQLLTIVT